MAGDSGFPKRMVQFMVRQVLEAEPTEGSPQVGGGRRQMSEAEGAGKGERTKGRLGLPLRSRANV